MNKKVKKYTKKDGTVAYYFKTYIGIDETTGKKVFTTRRGFKTAREAELTLIRLLNDVQENGLPKKSYDKFEDLVKLWLPLYETTVKTSTYVVQSDAIRLHILPQFQDMYLSKITPAYCQTIVTEWRGYYAKFHNLIGLTQKMFDYAISIDLMEDNPMRKVIRPKKKDREIDYSKKIYTREELAQFLELLNHNASLLDKLLFNLLAHTGMRKSEVLALYWSDIDFDKQLIHVNRTLAKGKNNETIMQTPKTKSSKRVIGIHKDLIELLKVWQLEQRKMFLKNGVKVKHKDQLILTTRFNEHLYIDYPGNAYKRIIKGTDLHNISIHGFRHTHCSLLFESGAEIKAVQERLGHSEFRTTMDIYLHLNPDKISSTANVYDSFMKSM